MSLENRFLNQIWKDENFFRLLPKVLLTSALYPHFENFWLTRLVRARLRLESRRKWLLSLGLSWLAALLPLVIIAVLAHFSSYANLWTWLWDGARLQEPPQWIFLLGDARIPGLLFCAAIAATPALITGWGFWTWILVPVGLFPGILSLPGAWVMVLTERAALWVRAYFVSSDSSFKKDIGLRFAIAMAVWLALFAFGPVTRDWLQYLTGGASFNPESRFIQWSLGLAFWSGLETALALAVLHFYYPPTSEREEPEIWNLRLARFKSPWDRTVLHQLKARGEVAWGSLQTTLQDMDLETRKRIPAPVLSRMNRQLSELELLLQRQSSPKSSRQTVKDKSL